MDQYIKSFIIGSSLPVFLHFFLKVRTIDDKIKNFSYEDYTIIAPLYLGFMNSLSLYLSKQFEWSLEQRLFYIGVISGIFVCILARSINSYNFTDEEWKMYYLRIITKHILTFSVIIYLLEKIV